MTKDDLIYGRIMPQQLEAEKACLAAALTSKGIFRKAKLRDYHFYLPAHGTIWSAMESLDLVNKPIDLITVTNKLEENGKLQDIGGAFELMQIAETAILPDHFEAHQAIIMEKYQKRAIIEAGTKAIQASYNDTDEESPEDILTELNLASANISKEGSVESARPKMEVFEDIDNSMERAQKSGMSGIPILGIPGYDLNVDGGNPGDVHGIAGRPGSGKTALVNTALSNDIKKGIQSTLIQLEMTDTAMTRRLLSSMSGVPLSTIKSGQLTKGERLDFESAKQRYYDSKVSIEDYSGINVMRLRSIILDHVSKGCEKVYIDHFGLLQWMGNRGNEETELGKNSNMIKQIAKEAHIPIILLIQLNREAAKRGDKRFQLTDLRGSGRLEQDLDTATGLFRPKIFADPGETIYYKGSTEYEMATYAELNNRKNREGDLFNEKIKFMISHFEEMAPTDF